MLFLAENTRDGGWFYRVVGTAIATQAGFEATGRHLTDLGARLDVATIQRDFSTVAQTCQPVRQISGLPVIGRDWIDYDRLLLPFGEAGDVTHILGVCCFKD